MNQGLFLKELDNSLTYETKSSQSGLVTEHLKQYFPFLLNGQDNSVLKTFHKIKVTSCFFTIFSFDVTINISPYVARNIYDSPIPICIIL